MGTFVFFLILFGIVGAIAYKVVTNKKSAAPTTTTPTAINPTVVPPAGEGKGGGGSTGGIQK